jgi:TonB family protein
MLIIPMFARSRSILLWLGCAISAAVSVTSAGAAQQSDNRQIAIAILDFGKTPTGRAASDRMALLLAGAKGISILDRDLVRVAARGAGYEGSLNLALPEARDLGAAIGCDLYLLGDAQTIRRSKSTGDYFESYASLFLVSTRTGRLIAWERPSFEAASAGDAEKKLLDDLSGAERRDRYLGEIHSANETEQRERELTPAAAPPVIEEAADDEATNQARGLRLPRAFRRLKPTYPDSAARADAEGTVDVLVDLDQQGDVTRVEIARWAGFGLDEATVATVRQMHFFPALRDGTPIPLRVLLRYNFKRPAK